MGWPSFRGALLIGAVHDAAEYRRDFGGVIAKRPAAVLRAADVDDVVRAVRHARACGMRVVARGDGHTTAGQTQLEGALVIDMRRLSSIAPIVCDRVRVGAGARWSRLVAGVHAFGRSPPVLTDYLDLTVGGTLSVGGVGGQSFAHGLQVDNVLELEVVTGTGARIRCSPTCEPELFHGCLGGLGQLGIIVEATLRLVAAPQRVRVRTLPYDDLDAFLDAQHAIAEAHVADYVVGNFLPPARPGVGIAGWQLLLECVVHVDAREDRGALEAAIGGACLDREPPARELGYLEYAFRLDAMVADWHRSSAWSARHPWIDLFLPREHATRLITTALGGLDRDGLGEGYVMTYPLQRSLRGPSLPVLPAGERVLLFDILPTVARNRPEQLAAFERRRGALLEAALASGATVYAIGHPLDDPALATASWQRTLGDARARLDAARRRWDPDGVCGGDVGLFNRSSAASTTSR